MDVRIGGHVQKVNGKELSYEEFAKKYMMKNQPVVVTGLMDDWRACKDWVDSNGQPNLQFLSTHFGNSMVQVADCGSREFTDQSRVEMLVSDFIDQWPKDSSHNHVDSSINGTIGKSVLYLKDWHFFKEYPAYDAYTTPHFFRDDWLNLYLDCYSMHMDPNTFLENDDISCSDYRFVYMGAKGTWTPLHADVFRSYSWSANVCGKKRWVLLSPSQCHLVFDRNMKNCVYDVFDDVSKTKFPGFDKASWLECIQEQNEIIFVPSGWYHQVYNMEDTISINHNWFNAYNLSWVVDLLSRDYKEAKEYIEDIRDICDDFESLCQRNLAANTGMNFYDFLILLARFALANLIQVCCLDRDCENGDGGSSPIIQHLALNLASIQNIALKMKSFTGSSGNHAVLVDLAEALTETKFLKLCESLSETYGTIHDRTDLSFRVKKVLMDGSETLDISRICADRVCNPGDLASFIANLWTKFQIA